MQTGSSWVCLAWVWITLSPSPPKNSDQENLKIQAAINPADFSQISTSECAVQNASLSRHRNTCLLLSPGLFANWNEKCFSSHKILSLALSSRSTNSFSSLINFLWQSQKEHFTLWVLCYFPRKKGICGLNERKKELKHHSFTQKALSERAEKRDGGQHKDHTPHSATRCLLHVHFDDKIDISSRDFKPWHVAPCFDRLHSLKFLQRRVLYKPQTCFNPNLQFSYNEPTSPKATLLL